MQVLREHPVCKNNIEANWERKCRVIQEKLGKLSDYTPGLSEGEQEGKLGGSLLTTV